MHWLLVLLGAHMATGSALHHRYCIVGAGPAGLQLARLLHNSGRDYVVFERADAAGSFFERYPRSRVLNTAKAGPGLHLDRLSLFGHPDGDRDFEWAGDGHAVGADAYRAYLQRFSRGLNVRYGKEVTVARDGGGASSDRLLLVEGGQHVCKVVVVAAGLSTPKAARSVTRGAEYLEDYSEVSYPDPSLYTNQTVCVLGNGQSAVETAAHAARSATAVRVIGRRPVRWSTESGSMEDVSLAGEDLGANVGFEHHEAALAIVRLADGRLALVPEDEVDEMKPLFQQHAGQCTDPDHAACRTRTAGREGIGDSGSSDSTLAKYLEEHPFVGRRMSEVMDLDHSAKGWDQRRDRYTANACDRVISCTGFVADETLFHESAAPLWHPQDRGWAKFPVLDPVYQAVAQPHMYFAGALAHDGAAGHIAHFRWHVQALYRHLEMRYEQVPWPAAEHPRFRALDVAEALVSRVHESAAIRQACRPGAGSPGNSTLKAGNALLDIFVLSPTLDAAVHYPAVPEAYALTVASSRPFMALGFDCLPGLPHVRGQAWEWGIQRPSPVVLWYRNMELKSSHHIGPSEGGGWGSAERHLAPLVQWIRQVLRN
eukprot:TRINITY_DN1258_c0_g1_i12.p1 TRINITY_DN1258_c0_g1~~TRINITY_DN1258_c0_g1_i12.p1  ORF type:complete len:598 (+),score=83.67 TRINITY_DN1258_c0_g1_i12:53-1846(+)